MDCLLDSKPIPPMHPPDLPSEMGGRIVDQVDDKRGDDDYCGLLIGSRVRLGVANQRELGQPEMK